MQFWEGGALAPGAEPRHRGAEHVCHLDASMRCAAEAARSDLVTYAAARRSRQSRRWVPPLSMSSRSVRMRAGVRGLCGAVAAVATGAGAEARTQEDAGRFAVEPFVVEAEGPLEWAVLRGNVPGGPEFDVVLHAGLGPGERRRFVLPALVPAPDALALGSEGVPTPEVRAVVTSQAGRSEPGQSGQAARSGDDARGEGVVPTAPLRVLHPPAARAPFAPRAVAAASAAGIERLPGPPLRPPAHEAPRRVSWVALLCAAVALPLVVAWARLGRRRRAHLNRRTSAGGADAWEDSRGPDTQDTARGGRRLRAARIGLALLVVAVAAASAELVRPGAAARLVTSGTGGGGLVELGRKLDGVLEDGALAGGAAGDGATRDGATRGGASRNGAARDEAAPSDGTEDGLTSDAGLGDGAARRSGSASSAPHASLAACLDGPLAAFLAEPVPAPSVALRVGPSPLDADGTRLLVERAEVWARRAALPMPDPDEALSAALGGDGLRDVFVTLDAAGFAATGARPLLAVVPAGIHGAGLGTAPGSGSGWTWLLAAPRGAWVVERTAPAGLRLLREEVNTWGDLDEVFLRGADGAWARRGRWGLGEALPAAPAEAPTQARAQARAQGTAPPGWLAAGLPQGVRVLVARLAPGTWGGEAWTPPAGASKPAGEPGAGGVWLRRVDF